jgi:two-component system, cell cycle response regulator
MQKILVIDDEPLNIKLIEAYLDAAPYFILKALNVSEAQQILQQHPDVVAILLDRMMPDLDGIEFVKMIKQDQRFKKIPIIMQTAVAESYKIMEGLNSGVDHYLTKPYDQEMLIATLHKFTR